MFNDKRNKKVILLAHCLLNQNSISDGTADLPSQFDKIINLLISKKIGIIQLSCPELTCLGLDRQDINGAKRDLLQENTRIRNLLEKNENQKILKIKAKEIVEQIEEYRKYDFEIIGIVGVNRSPGCGIETTTIDGKEKEGKGTFMRILEEEFRQKKIKIKMVGSKTSMEKESLEMLRRLIEEKGTAPDTVYKP